jgi:hypothetical protein
MQAADDHIARTHVVMARHDEVRLMVGALSISCRFASASKAMTIPPAGITVSALRAIPCRAAEQNASTTAARVVSSSNPRLSGTALNRHLVNRDEPAGEPVGGDILGDAAGEFRIDVHHRKARTHHAGDEYRSLTQPEHRDVK